MPRTRRYMRAYIRIQDARDEREVARARARERMHSRRIKYVNARASSDSGRTANIPLLRVDPTAVSHFCPGPDYGAPAKNQSLQAEREAILFPPHLVPRVSVSRALH